MKEIQVQDWDEFERELQKLEQFRTDLVSEKKHMISELLYRGQSKSSWHLQTTLERAAGKDMRPPTYHRIIQRIKAQIEAFTNRHGDIPDSLSEVWEPEVYKYMTHLRHYGFPSPLLDWTKSPYIAAYLGIST